MQPWTWIQTRDGSPTLWHNELGESYRSVKGAFTESWTVFVKPALELWRAHRPDAFRVGEFGLGAGTNWALWSTVTALEPQLCWTYEALERDPRAFELARQYWIQNPEILATFLEQNAHLKLSPEDIARRLQESPAPRIFSSLEEWSATDLPPYHVWFHDPFGYDVNPEGYSLETLQLCARHWNTHLFLGASYACNRKFRESLSQLELPLKVEVLSTGDSGLKRERLEFRA